VKQSFVHNNASDFLKDFVLVCDTCSCDKKNKCCKKFKKKGVHCKKCPKI